MDANKEPMRAEEIITIKKKMLKSSIIKFIDTKHNLAITINDEAFAIEDIKPTYPVGEPW